MQISIYYTEEDEDLIELIEAAANIERKSKGALMLSVLDDYFEKKRELEAAVHCHRALYLSSATGTG